MQMSSGEPSKITQASVIVISDISRISDGHFLSIRSTFLIFYSQRFDILRRIREIVHLSATSYLEFLSNEL
jgi:hypothetical protein